MIIKIKPVNAKVNLSRQNGATETTRRLFKVGDHASNIGILPNLGEGRK
jgi:hypothetical protein